MSGRPKKGTRGPAAQKATDAKVSRGKGGRGGQSSARPPFPVFCQTAQPIRPQNVEEVVEYLTKRSSSSSSTRVSQADKSGQSSAVGRGYQDESMSTASVHLDPTSDMAEESAELFDHSVSHLLLADAQSLMESEVGSEVMEEEEEEDKPNISLQRERTDRQRGMLVPPAAAYCEVVSSGNEDDEGSDATWVPDRVQEEEESEVEEAQVEEEEAQPARGESRRPTPSRAPPVVSRPTTQTSACWPFFAISSADPTVAICKICQKGVKRGKNPRHLGTSCLTRHMITCHLARWQEHLKSPQKGQRSVRPPPSPPRAQLPAPATRTHHLSGASTDRDDMSAQGVGAASVASPSSTPPAVISRRQLSIPHMLERKKKYTPSHPQAQRLNGSLAKLLALQLLPFNLVESRPFREFAEVAVPQWQVPSRHYFARKAVPSLYEHVEGNVVSSLAKSVSQKIHLTADSWSSKHGQGRYISVTAHWVTLLASGRDSTQGSVLQMVLPPRLETAGGVAELGRSITSTPPSSSSSSSSMPSSAEWSLEPNEVPRKRSKGYSMAQAKRCHAVLQLVCLGDRQHTAPEILGALQAQAQRWLTPRQLQAGMVVSDNGANLLSALRQGKLTHVPCLAHVLNLVVQRFLKLYPGLQDVLRMARRVSSHFRRSYSATARLAELQRELHLPVHRLICDMPTRWNSTLAMLQRLYTQQRAVNQYLCEYGTSTGSARLGFFSPRQWLLMKDACVVLSPFEEATRMVSRDSACISDTIPVVFLLEHILRGIMDKALEAEQHEEEEDFLTSQGPLYPDPIIPTSQRLQEDREGEEEDDHDSDETFLGFDEEEEEEDMRPSARPDFTPSGHFGVVRGWGEDVADPVLLSEPEESASQAFANLRRMCNLILQSLRKDPRIRAIKDTDHYWLASLLDHRYKAKVSQLLPSTQRADRMKSLEDSLKRILVNSFPDSRRVQVRAHPSVASSAAHERSVGEGVRLTDAFRSFFSPQRPGLSAATSHRQRLHHMVDEYLRAQCDMEAFPSDDPLAYWVLRLDHWPELAQYAMELLSCPASSVLSERAFSAAGGFVTDHRTRLSTDSVDRLTFIKMNQSWISSFDAPAADVHD